MDALALLRRARKAGLRIEPAGDKLMVRGPKRAEPVVKLLAEHKAEVLAALVKTSMTPSCCRRRLGSSASYHQSKVSQVYKCPALLGAVGCKS
jgi:leucyl aminopeptidase (aminopeptidase T)